MQSQGVQASMKFTLEDLTSASASEESAATEAPDNASETAPAEPHANETAPSDNASETAPAET